MFFSDNTKQTSSPNADEVSCRIRALRVALPSFEGFTPSDNAQIRVPRSFTDLAILGCFAVLQFDFVCYYTLPSFVCKERKLLNFQFGFLKKKTNFVVLDLRKQPEP